MGNGGYYCTKLLFKLTFALCLQEITFKSSKEFLSHFTLLVSLFTCKKHRNLLQNTNPVVSVPLSPCLVQRLLLKQSSFLL